MRSVRFVECAYYLVKNSNLTQLSVLFVHTRHLIFFYYPQYSHFWDTGHYEYKH
jgi:hypothetical protein